MTGFGPAHLPYGVVEAGGDVFAATRLDDDVLDLRGLPRHGTLFAQPSIDALLAAGAAVWTDVRAELQASLPALRRVPAGEAVNRLPFTVADYVDFYASEQHATNVGRIFRPNAEPLTPNWKHLPIGYHGRSGTVVVSGTPVRRPSGQYREASGEIGFGPSRKLDIEAEVGFVVGGASRLGEPVPLAGADEHLFGVCLLNDWSARDIQAWEYVPLGPFLGKSFATTISGWITPLAALDAARVAPPPRDVVPLPYMDDRGRTDGLDLALTVRLNGTTIARPPFASMYWTPAQMLAHMTVNGASVRPGDLFGSGTVSGTRPDERGSLLELTWNGEQPIELDDGTTRTFLQDGDEVALTATARAGDGTELVLGEVRGTVRG